MGASWTPWALDIGSDIIVFKRLVWIGDSLERVRAFAATARKEVGFELSDIASLPEAVYVLHAFEKRSRKTGKPDIELARTRFKTLMQERRQR